MATHAGPDGQQKEGTRTRFNSAFARKVDDINTNKLKEELDVSNFDPNAIIRGAQLTLVGAHRALQNPAIFTNDHYKQAAAAVLVGIGIRLAIMVPVSSDCPTASVSSSRLDT